MAQVTADTTVHDVVVIGSGAGGGTVTKVLADLGVSVLLHRSRPDAEPGGPQGAHVAVPGAASRRGRRRARPTRAGRPASPTARPTAARSSRASRTPSRRAATSRWFRSRILGGRTNHYGRVTLRMADYDFKPHIDRRPRLRLADQLRGPRAVLRQGRALHRRDRHRRRHPQRARRHLQPAGAAAAHDVAGPARVREARHPRRGRAPGGHDRGAATDGRPATTAASAAAAARRRRTTPSSYVQIFPAMKTGPGAGDRQRDGARADHRRDRARSPRSRTSTRRPAARSRCAAAPSCSPRAPASRRGCCSTRSRRAIRRGSRTRPARSAAT